jgi:hypothetical protein
VAQEDDRAALVTLPPIPAFKLSPESYFILRLRRVPAAESAGEPDTRIIETYLKRKSNAFGTKDAYVESDLPEELAVAAALVSRAALAVDELFGVPKGHPIKSVIMKTQEDFYTLSDAWAKDEHLRRMARSFSSIFVDG